jgi:hypothetical protein
MLFIALDKGEIVKYIFLSNVDTLDDLLHRSLTLLYFYFRFNDVFEDVEVKKELPELDYYELVEKEEYIRLEKILEEKCNLKKLGVVMTFSEQYGEMRGVIFEFLKNDHKEKYIRYVDSLDSDVIKEESLPLKDRLKIINVKKR